jgi:hypothetical protein
MWLNGVLQPNSRYEIPIHPEHSTAILHALYHEGGVIPYNVGDRWKVFRDSIKTKKKSNQIYRNHLALPFYSKIKGALKRFKEKDYTSYEDAMNELSFSI